jgi:hypothetical protein
MNHWLRVMGAACLAGMAATAALAEQIRFGDGGSIFGGATWTITPNDHVRFDAYQFEGALTAREGWVWDNPDAKQGHITFAIPGAFATAAAIASEGLADVGATPSFQSGCMDAGSLILEVDAAGVGFEAYVDRCAGQDNTPANVRAHYEAVLAVQREIITTLGLDRLQ